MATGFDSYIFDMDGTLWDAVDSYCAVWNHTIEHLKTDTPKVTRQALAPLMGMSIDNIYTHLVGNHADKDKFFEQLEYDESTMMPSLGGKLYPNVREVLEQLKQRGARLFMVSNCGADGLPNFLNYTGLSDLIGETLSLGSSGKSKTDNIKDLIIRHNLKHPIYVGDTSGDRDYTHAAGIPFCWAAYGFGKNVTDCEYTIHSITDLLAL